MISDKIKTQAEMSEIRQKLKKHGKRLVFTNGCFDIIHKGHVMYLEAARELGDALVVGLNSDASVKRLKGESRPVNSELDRAIVLSAMESVSYVVIFGEDTPWELINELTPDVLVKGGDWSIEEIVGSDVVLSAGGEVKSLNYYAGYSTTGIIDKMEKKD